MVGKALFADFSTAKSLSSAESAGLRKIKMRTSAQRPLFRDTLYRITRQKQTARRMAPAGGFYWYQKIPFTV
jgi:hypothetical protein